MGWARWAVTFERLPCWLMKSRKRTRSATQRRSPRERALLEKPADSAATKHEARRDGEGRAKARKTLEGCHPTTRTYVGYPPTTSKHPARRSASRTHIVVATGVAANP